MTECSLRPLNRGIQIYKDILYSARWYILIIIGLCFVWTVAGIIVALLAPGLVAYLVQYLEKTFQSILGNVETLPRLDLALALLRQNAIACLYGLFLGVILGLLPVFSIAFNFFTLGFLFAPILAPSLFLGYQGSVTMFFLGIVPHGIFELPALVLAAGFGLRLGWAWLLPQASGQRWLVFRSSLIDAFRMVPPIIILLIIAAFVESFVTSRLI